MKAIFILEGHLDKVHHSALSEAMGVLAKDWGLSSYLDKVIEDNVSCKHKLFNRLIISGKDYVNAITSECSDCNEQEFLNYQIFDEN